MSWFVAGKKTEACIQDYPEVKVRERLKKIEISGYSRMSDPGEYYDQLIKKLESYYYSFNKTLILDFRLEFINSTSILLILQMLFSLQQLAEREGHLMVDWYYEEDDETIQETGEIFAASLKIPFELKIIPLNHNL
jgi:hypothetical protein